MDPAHPNRSGIPGHAAGRLPVPHRDRLADDSVGHQLALQVMPWRRNPELPARGPADEDPQPSPVALQADNGELGIEERLELLDRVPSAGSVGGIRIAQDQALVALSHVGVVPALDVPAGSADGQGRHDHDSVMPYQHGVALDKAAVGQAVKDVIGHRLGTAAEHRPLGGIEAAGGPQLAVHGVPYRGQSHRHVSAQSIRHRKVRALPALHNDGPSIQVGHSADSVNLGLGHASRRRVLAVVPLGQGYRVGHDANSVTGWTTIARGAP